MQRGLDGVALLLAVSAVGCGPAWFGSAPVYPEVPTAVDPTVVDAVVSDLAEIGLQGRGAPAADAAAHRLVVEAAYNGRCERSHPPTPQLDHSLRAAGVDTLLVSPFATGPSPDELLRWIRRTGPFLESPILVGVARSRTSFACAFVVMAGRRSSVPLPASFVRVTN